MHDWVLLAISGGLTLASLFGAAVIEARTAWLPRTVRAAGLTWRDAERADGRVGGVFVVARATLDAKNNRTAVQITLPPLPSLGLDARLETVGAQLAATLGTPDLRIGDPAFDDLVALFAVDEPLARALLDRPTRERIAQAVVAGGQLAEGRWQLWVGRAHRGDGLQRAVRALVDAHLALSATLDDDAVQRRLRAVATEDRPALVRLGALRSLLRRGGADDAFLAGCQRDVDVEVRLTAAIARGEGGRDVLAEVMRSGSRSWRVRAALSLGRLGAGPRTDEVEQVLVAALVDPDLAAEAADGLAQFGRPGVVGALAQAADHSGHPRGVRTAIRAALQAVRSRIPAHAVGALGLADSGASEGALGLAAAPADRGPEEDLDA